MITSKNQIIDLLDTICVQQKVDEPTKINIDIYSQKEAFDNYVDDESFVFTNKPVEYYLTFADHPDYCFIYPNTTIEEAQLVIISWLNEIGIIS